MDAGIGDVDIALLRAADISPLVKERTIGPDIDIRSNENNETQLDMSAKNQKNRQKKPKSPAILESVFSSQISTARLLDYETIKLSVSLQCEQIEAVKRRKALKNELLEEHNREAEFLQRKRQESLRIFQEAHEKLLLKKQHDEELISQKAEQHAIQSEAKDQREIEAIHIQRRRALRLVIFNGISQCQEHFRDKYSAVIKLLLACQRTHYNKSLNELIEQFNQLIAKLKNNDYGPAELRTAQKICESLEVLEHKIITEIEELIKESEKQREEELQQQQEHDREQQQQQQQQEQDREQQQQQIQQLQKQQQQQQQLNEQAMKAAEAEKLELAIQNPPPQNLNQIPQNTNLNSSAQLSKSISNNDDGLGKYTQIMTYYQAIVEKVKPLKNDESWKKYRFACQKAINTPINAISAVSPQHLQDKFDKLYGFINGQPSNEVRTSDHPLGRDYCLLLMAKKFVSQGSTAVSSNQQAAFPIASVLISLWKLMPELGQLFLAYLYKESPYMVPCFLRQQDGQTAEDFLKQLGYHFPNGQIEPAEMYLKRQAGITRLYAACIITTGRQMNGPTHPHGLSHAWHWLAKIVSMEPLPDLSATIIMEFLQIVGGPMLKTYGKQFIKLLVFLQRVYFPQLAAIDKGGPKARLELQLNKFLQEGRIEMPLGILPPGYW